MSHVAATAADFAVAGRLLHDFNTEYDDPSPGSEALAARVAELVGAGATDVLLDGAADAVSSDSATAVCVLRYRPSLWSLADECYLAELYVAPSSRGTGIGRRLLRAAVERARARGCDYLDLATSEDDVAARHLYEAEGFRRTEGEGGPLTFHYEMDL
ncbi:GNAT family N-acetyltransferase [Oryzobacter sp. R7]|uniref:GNAT family N-acetyltransferase n=1 Tax=Oryzobacter faecalis TaxID=3388656 RepID=UPI00398D1DD7